MALGEEEGVWPLDVMDGLDGYAHSTVLSSQALIFDWCFLEQTGSMEHQE